MTASTPKIRVKSKVDRALLNTGNELLNLISKHMSAEWKIAMNQRLRDSEREWAMVKLAGRTPVGVVAEGTGVFRQKIGFDVASFNKTMQFLKDHGRIMQLGQGKGKVLLVIDTDPLLLEEIIDPSTIVLDSEIAEEIGGLAHGEIATKIVQLINRLNLTKSQVLHLQQENKDLIKKLKHFESQGIHQG